MIWFVMLLNLHHNKTRVAAIKEKLQVLFISYLIFNFMAHWNMWHKSHNNIH